jgi:hypothetical protein
LYEEAAGFFELQQHEVAMARTAAPTSSDTKLRMEEAVILRWGRGTGGRLAVSTMGGSARRWQDVLL